MALYTSTQNQSDSSFEKDFGELRAGNIGHGLAKGKGDVIINKSLNNTELSNQGDARAKTPPLVHELFSIKSSIEKTEKQDARQGREGGMKQDGKQPKDTNDMMNREKLFGKNKSMTIVSPAGSAGHTSRKKWQVNDHQEILLSAASKDSGREDDQTPAF